MEKVDVENLANKNHPGVSGKAKDKKSWINFSSLKKQHKMLQERAKSGATDEAMSGFESGGQGNNLVGRTGLEDQQELHPNQMTNQADQKLHENIKVALQRNPETDLSKVFITVLNRDVSIEGFMSDAKEGRAIEAVIQNIPGVRQVFNNLKMDS